MNFLYPSFLFGLLAISIPIIIHLFNLQKPRKVLFPNVRFLKQVQQITSNKLKLKHLLILLARIGFVIFLVLMFAQPFLINKDSVNMKGKPFVSVYLDNSFSMQNEQGEEKALDAGVRSIQKLTELFPGTTSYGLLTNDFEGKDQYFRNKEKISERLSEINFSNIHRQGDAILKRQQQILDQQNAGNKHVIWFSDFQKSTIGDISRLKLDSTASYHWVPVQNEEVSNVSVDSVWLENPLVKAGENNTLQVKLFNSGKKEVRELTLKLYMDNVQVSSAVVNMGANAYVNASFIFNINGEGQKKCVIRFEDYPVVFDNEYFLTLNVSPRINILHLYENEGDYMTGVFANETIFNATNSRSGDFDYSAISRSHLIVLNELKTIAPALVKPLKDFVENGGSLVIFPSPDLSTNGYEPLTSALSLSAPVPVKLDTSRRPSVEMLPPDFNNPFFQNIFERKDPRMAMPYAFPVVDWGRRGEVLLKYKNNEPFLSLNQFGKGKIYLAASPVKDFYTSLPRHSLFVPVMYKMAFNSIVAGEQLAFSFQERTIPIGLGDDLPPSNTVYTLEGDNFRMIPAQWISGSRLVLDMPAEQMKAGFYNLKLGDKTVRTLAVNYGKAESRLEYFTPDELAQISKNYKNLKIYNTESSEQFADYFRQDNLGTPLWKYCLIMTLLFLMVEILLIRFL